MIVVQRWGVILCVYIQWEDVKLWMNLQVAMIGACNTRSNSNADNCVIRQTVGKIFIHFILDLVSSFNSQLSNSHFGPIWMKKINHPSTLHKYFTTSHEMGRLGKQQPPTPWPNTHLKFSTQPTFFFVRPNIEWENHLIQVDLNWSISYLLIYTHTLLTHPCIL